MQTVRIISVWVISLCLVSYCAGRGEGFLFVFMLYTMFMTVPALIILSVALLIEGAIVKKGFSAAAMAVGPIIGIVFPVILIATSPSRVHVANSLLSILPITLTTGCVWAMSFLLRIRFQARPYDAEP